MYLEFEMRSAEISYPVEYIPRSHESFIIPVTIICLVFAWISVSLRFITRAFLVRSLGKDDYFMIAALVSFAAIWNAFFIYISNTQLLQGFIYGLLRFC